MEQFKRQPTQQFSLSSEPAVHGYGPSGPVNIAFLGEAPGSEEAVKGLPFIGPAGEFMERALCSPAKVWFRGSWLTNVIDRQPPTWNGKPNAINSPEAIECIEAQTDELWRELEWLVRSKHIKVLVAVGGTASLALGIKEAITKIRGSVYEISLAKRRALSSAEIEAGETSDVVCVPVLHPSGLLRNRWTKKASGTMGDTLATIDDLKKVQALVVAPYKRPIERFLLRPTADEIVSWIHQRLADDELVRVDTESKGDIDLEPSKRQLTIVGLARNAEDAISISFLEEDGLQTWTNGSLDRIRAALDLLFTTGRLVFQNALHDVPLIRASGFKIDARRIVHDTLLLHHAVSPEDKHNLAYIVSRFGVTTYWKEDVEKKSFGKVYNLRDCVVLAQVEEPLLNAAHKVDPTGKLLEVYRDETMALLPSIIRMHERGMKLDPKRLKMWQHFADAKLAKVEGELRAAAQVHSSFNFNGDYDTQALFFGVFPEEQIRIARIVSMKTYEQLQKENDQKIAEVEAEIAKREAAGRTATKAYALSLERLEKLKNWKPTKVWQEAVELVERYKDLKQLWPGIKKWNGRKTEKKQQLSLSKKTYPEMLNVAFKRQEELNDLIRPTEEHQEEKLQLSQFISVTSLYGAYSRVSHIVSTYYTFETWEDGRVHGRLTQTGTATGRLSMRDPSLHNIPVREAWAQQVRRPLVSDEGFVFLLADYENIEFVMYAYITGDPKLIQIVETGKNVHDVNVPLLFSDQGVLDASHPLWKPARRAAKAYQFGRRQYGGGKQEVHRNMIADAPELEFTMKQFDRVEAMYYEMYPVAAEWDRYIREYARKRRRVESPFGRVRLLNGNDRDIEKQALNMGAQSAAATVMNRAQLRVEKRLIGAGLMEPELVMPVTKTETILQIHDQLIMETPIKDVPSVVPIMIEEMTRPVQFTNWRGQVCTIHPKVDPEFGVDMYDTVSIPFIGPQVDVGVFERELAELRSKPVTFTDTDIDTVDGDTFEGDEDDDENGQ